MSTARPNLILLVADDHGRESLGCYGNAAVHTPHLDHLSRDGVTFQQAFCTTASCAASRSVILTGLYNHANGTYGHTHGQHHFSLFEHITTLPAYLQQAGYRTGRVGKKHYAPESNYPFQTHIADAERDDVTMSENCRSFITASGEPFFLYWCSFNPHRSGSTIAHAGLEINRFGNPEQAFPGDQERQFRPEQVIVPPFLNDDLPTRLELTQYYQSIARLDRGVGRLINILKETGQYDNTVIIYISDNGAAFPGAKTTLYEPGMRLPCLMKKPGQMDAGTKCDNLVCWADITPTLLDYAESKTAAKLHGKSFRDTSKNNAAEEIFAAHTFHEITNYYPMRVVRTPRHKFIWNIAHPLPYSFAADLWKSGTWQHIQQNQLPIMGKRKVQDFLQHPKFELYDLKADPEELNNLAELPEHQSLIRKFCDQLKDFQSRTNDPWRHKWEYE